MATTTPVETRYKLGRLPVRTDARTLALPRYVNRSKLPPPPPYLDLAAAVTEWPMYANDRIGDCTTAAAAHMIEAWTAPTRGHAVVMSGRSVLLAFDKLKRVDPATGEEGAVELEVLNYWRKRGIGGHRVRALAPPPPWGHPPPPGAPLPLCGRFIAL